MKEPFSHPDWLYELKYDGFRGLINLQQGKVTLVSRKGHVYKRFDELCEHLAPILKARNAIIGRRDCLYG